jgi:uncharacterized secreted protein with C-terminal beta-propeller domain
MSRRRTAALAGTAAVALTGALALQLLPGTTPVARADRGLVGYQSCADLLAAYREQLRVTATAYGFGGGAYYGGIPLAEDNAAGADGEQSARSSGAVGSGPTGTNLQEQGVDEPDSAKLRDGRLVVLTGNTLRVLSADDDPEILGSVRIGGRNAWGGELLLVGDRALVILSGWQEVPPLEGEESGSDGSDVATRMIAPYGQPLTRVVLLGLDGDDPRVIEQATYEATYVSARSVDGTVRLVTTTRPQPRGVYPRSESSVDKQAALAANQRIANAVTLDEVLPQVTRTDAAGNVDSNGSAVECDRVYHAKNGVGVSTLTVTTMRPEQDGLAPSDTTAVTTDGDLVYSSADRLFVATSRWGTVGPWLPLDSPIAGRLAAPAPEEVSTELHGFDTSSPTSTTYVGSGSVPGYVYGRWALSFHEGALRVATTKQPPWESDRSEETSSMVVKLVERDGKLVETGRVGGLGKTEQIRAVRYFGDIAAVVTFRQTDPLYMLDLSGEPRVLGELKIPGFSTYLHPVGDDLLLGIGQSATLQGQVTGMQVSVFDVSDLSAPRQVDRLKLGPGWSPALDDSRAFTYDPQRRLATFAFTGYDEATYDTAENGAIGISVGEDGTLRRAGLLELSAELYAARVLTDGERLFVVGDQAVVTGDADTFQRTGSVLLG